MKNLSRRELKILSISSKIDLLIEVLQKNEEELDVLKQNLEFNKKLKREEWRG